MTWALGIRITNRRDGSSYSRVFTRLPVRIGRNALNDLQLQEDFVSQFHLVLEQQNNRLWLRDLGSTNGTFLRGIGAAQPNQLVDLASCGFEFSIVDLDLRTYTATVESEPVSPSAQRPRLGVTSMLAKVDPGKLMADASRDALIAKHRALYATYRAGWSELIRSLDRELSGLPASARPHTIEQIAREFDAVDREPDFQSLRARHGAPATTGASQARDPHQLEAVALEGVRELAFDFCPQAGALESVDDLVRFVERVQVVLDVFLQSFISLREGQRQFESEFALRRVSGAPQIPVELAQTHQALSQALLNWHDSGTEGIAYVKSTLGDLMIHQMAMLSGVMSGVRTLVEKFSPAEIEKRAGDSQFNSEGVGFGPFRYKSLWKTLEKIHADFSGEDKQVYSVLFGRQFAQAYEKAFGSGGRAGSSRPPGNAGQGTVPPGGWRT